MRIWCLTSLTLESCTSQTYSTPPYNLQNLDGSINLYYEYGKRASIYDSFKCATNYVLSEIRIGKRQRDDKFTFVLCRQGNIILRMLMTKDSLTILPRKTTTTDSDDVIDILVHQKNVHINEMLGNYIKKIRIRAIRSTKVRGGLTIIEAKIYNEYAANINKYANENIDKYEEAFAFYGTIKLPNQTTKKALEQKITDLYNAITDLCHLGLQEISLKARYNNYLFDNEELRFTRGNYDIKIEDYKSFYGCRLLEYSSINLASINEKWFIAEGLIRLGFSKTDIFNIQSSWIILANNIGKLQQLRVLELISCNIKEIPEKVYENLPQNLLCLVLANNDLKKISSKISNLIYFDKLSLKNNSNLTEDGLPWDDLPESLRILNIDNTAITKIPASIKRLKNLKVLNAQIPTLQVTELDALNKSLKRLTISNIAVLPAAPEFGNKEINSFTPINNDLTNAKSVKSFIDLSKNEIKICTMNFSIPPYSLLTVLNLSKNKLGSIEWKNLPSTLVTLDLSNNFLSEIVSVTNMNSLKEIILNNNRITKICDGFDQLPNIRVINLDDNELEELPEGFELIEGSEWLRIYLCNNKFGYKEFGTAEEENNEEIDDLHCKLWNRLPKTYQLFLSGNDLFELPCQLAGKFEHLEAIDCKLKYICPQIYNILYHEHFFKPRQMFKSHYSPALRIHLNIAKNDDIRTLTFIPHTIYPVAHSLQKPTDEHLNAFGFDMNGQRINTKNAPKWSTIISNESDLRKTQPFPTCGKKPIYAFKNVDETKNELKTFCKCCAYCDIQECKVKDTVMIEQLMMMDCVFIGIKEDTCTFQPPLHFQKGLQAGKWKAMIRTRLCKECIEKLKNMTEEAYNNFKNKEMDNAEAKKQRQNVVINDSVGVVQNVNTSMTPQQQEIQNVGAMNNTVNFAEPQNLQILPQFTINLPYCYPSVECLKEICQKFYLNFHSYPFYGYENFYNSLIFGTTTLYTAGIQKDENSGYKALAYLITGSEQCFNQIQNILYNHLYLSNFPQNFYTFYSNLLATPPTFLRECDLYVAANLFQLNIFVFNFLNDGKWFLINETRFEFSNNETQFFFQKPSILLWKISENNFDFYNAVLAASI